MTDQRALTIPQRLIRRFNTRDPFIIAEALDIEIMLRDDFKRQKGAYKVVLNNDFIFINNNLSDEMKRMVCAHELGHSHLHRELGKAMRGLIEYELFDMNNQREYDANAFAATLLLNDDEIIEYARDGYDIAQIAGIMGTNINLLLLKMNEMNRHGYRLNVPRTPSRKFLGNIEDGPGRL